MKNEKEIFMAFYTLREELYKANSIKEYTKECAEEAFEDYLTLNANEDLYRVEDLIDVVYDTLDVRNGVVYEALCTLKRNREMMKIIDFQDKSAFVCNELYHTIKATRPGSNVDGMVYTYDRITYEENVVLIFEDGHERKVNVTADSKWAIIKDVMNALE